MEVSGYLHATAAIPQEKEPPTPWIGGWVSVRSSVDTVAKRKNPITAPARN